MSGQRFCGPSPRQSCRHHARTLETYLLAAQEGTVACVRIKPASTAAAPPQWSRGPRAQATVPCRLVLSVGWVLHATVSRRTSSGWVERLAAACFAALFLWVGTASADDAMGPLTAERAVALAVAHSPELNALDHRGREETLKGAVATEIENPELRVGSFRTDDLGGDADGPLGNLNIGLRWSPPNSLVNAARREESLHLATSVTWEREDRRRALAARVRTLHAKALSLDSQIKLARSAVQMRAELAGTTQGMSDLEQSIAALDELEASADLLELEERRRDALRELAALVGLPTGTPLAVAGPELACEPPKEDVTVLVARAVKNDARLAARESKSRAISAEGTRARRQLMPWPSFVQLGYELSDHNTPGFGYVRFGIPLPLFNWNGDRIALLAEKRSALAAENDGDRLTLAHRVEQAVADARADAQLVARYTETAPRLVEQTEALLQRSLEAGKSTLADTAKLQTRRLSAQSAGMKTKLRCQLSLIELDRLVGR